PIEGVGAPTRRCARLGTRRCPATAGPWCTSVHPRLAARQRGILAFMPLTVVGPDRLIVVGEAARVPPGVGGCGSPAPRCRSHSPPCERLRKAPHGLPIVIVMGYRRSQETLAAQELLPYFIPWKIADDHARLPPKQGHNPGYDNGTQHPIQAREPLHSLR